VVHAEREFLWRETGAADAGGVPDAPGHQALAITGPNASVAFDERSLTGGVADGVVGRNEWLPGIEFAGGVDAHHVVVAATAIGQAAATGLAGRAAARETPTVCADQ